MLRTFRKAVPAIAVGWVYGMGGSLALAATPLVSDGLVAYWSFDDCTGQDASSNALHAALSTAPTCLDGKFGKAFGFSAAAQQFLTVQQHTLLNPRQQWTISFWIRHPHPKQEYWFPMLSKTAAEGGGGSNFEYLLYNAGGNLYYSSAGDGHGDTGAYTRTLSPNVWHHVAVVWDRTAHKSTYYVNGVKDVEGFGGGEVYDAYTSFNNNTADLLIGKHDPYRSWGGNPSYFDGDLDEVRIHNRALSATEVQALYTGVSPQPDTGCSTEQELFHQRYLGACGYEQSDTFDLAATSHVSRVRLWYDRTVAPNGLTATVTGPGGYAVTQATQLGSCYSNWCEGNFPVNRDLIAGHYSVSASSNAVCKNPSGESTMIVYGCAANSNPSTISQATLASYLQPPPDTAGPRRVWLTQDPLGVASLDLRYAYASVKGGSLRLEDVWINGRQSYLDYQLALSADVRYQLAGVSSGVPGPWSATAVDGVGFNGAVAYVYGPPLALGVHPLKVGDDYYGAYFDFNPVDASMKLRNLELLDRAGSQKLVGPAYTASASRAYSRESAFSLWSGPETVDDAIHKILTVDELFTFDAKLDGVLNSCISEVASAIAGNIIPGSNVAATVIQGVLEQTDTLLEVRTALAAGDEASAGSAIAKAVSLKAVQAVGGNADGLKKLWENIASSHTPEALCHDPQEALKAMLSAMPIKLPGLECAGQLAQYSGRAVQTIVIGQPLVDRLYDIWSTSPERQTGHIDDFFNDRLRDTAAVVRQVQHAYHISEAEAVVRLKTVFQARDNPHIGAVRATEMAIVKDLYEGRDSPYSLSAAQRDEIAGKVGGDNPNAADKFRKFYELLIRAKTDLAPFKPEGMTPLELHRTATLAVQALLDGTASDYKNFVAGKLQEWQPSVFTQEPAVCSAEPSTGVSISDRRVFVQPSHSSYVAETIEDGYVRLSAKVAPYPDANMENTIEIRWTPAPGTADVSANFWTFQPTITFTRKVNGQLSGSRELPTSVSLDRTWGDVCRSASTGVQCVRFDLDSTSAWSVAPGSTPGGVTNPKTVVFPATPIRTTAATQDDVLNLGSDHNRLVLPLSLRSLGFGFQYGLPDDLVVQLGYSF